jgi:uncharacterized protein YcfL
MKKLLATLGVLSLALVGCASEPEPKTYDNGYVEPVATQVAPAAGAAEPQFFQEVFQKDSDGRTVRCFYKREHVAQGGGVTMSCDWAGAIVHK